MNNYILLQKNTFETTESELVFDLPEEVSEDYSLRDMVLTNVTIANCLTDKFFQPLYIISKCIRETSLKLVNANVLNPEILKVLDILSRKFFYLTVIDFTKPYKPKTDEEMAVLNKKIITQFTALVKNDTGVHRMVTSKSNLKTINRLRDNECDAIDILSRCRLRILIDRAYASRSKLRTANDFFITAPVWSEFSDTYSIPDRKLLSGIRGLLYFAKDLKVPNSKKKSELFTTGNYFSDALFITQAHLDTFIKILETDCFKLNQPTDENLKEVYDLLASLDLKYSFVLSKMKGLYHFDIKNSLKTLERDFSLNSVLSSGSTMSKCMLEEFDYQLNSLEQEFGVCRLRIHNFYAILQIALREYINYKANKNNIDGLKSQKVRQCVRLNCIVLTSSLIDIPATPAFTSFSDHRFPNLTIEEIVAEHYPEFLNNPNLANLILNNFIFKMPDAAKFKIVKKADEEDNSKVYIYLYAFPNNDKSPIL